MAEDCNETDHCYQKISTTVVFVVWFSVIVRAADTIRIAYPSTSFTTLPILAAMKHGHFEQEGLRAELIFMRPNISVTAVVTGQVEFATVHGSSSGLRLEVCP